MSRWKCCNIRKSCAPCFANGVRSIMKMFRQVLSALLLGLIYTYRATLGWALGGYCRFHPTCSQYGLDAIRLHGPFYGAWLTLKRLLRCQPFSRGGYDPVPLPPDSAPPADSLAIDHEPGRTP